MSAQSMIDDFQRILNRTDCEDTDAAAFISQGFRLIQDDPNCRFWFMEKELDLNVESTSSFVASTDVLQIIDVLVANPAGILVPMKKLAWRDLQRIDPTDLPRAYARFQSTIQVRGSVPPGQEVQLLYYGKFTPFTGPDDENELSLNAPDLGVYAALVFAGDAFRMDQKADWTNTYKDLKQLQVEKNIALEFEGGPAVIEPIYRWD